jgi:NAD(P)-dependent dehydrogenase (short-subunit alcohol dehydrogenase family)
MAYNPYTLENKTILITGASSGIGRATAIEASKLGANVIITGRNEERLFKTFNMLEGNCNSKIVADLSNDEGINKILAFVSGKKLNGLVANAGISRPLPVNFVTREKINEIFPTNLESQILLFTSLLKNKILENGSSSVFTSSINGVMGGEKAECLYCATKGALSGFVKSACLDLAPKGIRVNCVCPGMIKTEILANGTITLDQLEENAKSYPLKRHGKPEEVAWAIIYLLSDASSFITGTNLVIDGGISNKM